MHFVISLLAIHAAEKLFGMNPVGDLRKVQFFSRHRAFGIPDAAENNKRSLKRSHAFSFVYRYRSLTCNQRSSR